MFLNQDLGERLQGEIRLVSVPEEVFPELLSLNLNVKFDRH